MYSHNAKTQPTYISVILKRSMKSNTTYIYISYSKTKYEVLVLVLLMSVHVDFEATFSFADFSTFLTWILWKKKKHFCKSL